MQPIQNKQIGLYILRVGLIACLLLALGSAWTLLLRNRDSVVLLTDTDMDISQAYYARPYLSGAIALMRQENTLAVRFLAKADHSTQLVRGLYAEALARQPDGWRAAVAAVGEEEPLPRYLLLELLVPHLAELNAQELSKWRERLRHRDPLLLVDLALELLLQGNNVEAERWARAFPDYEASSDAQRIAGQANLNRGDYAEAEAIFQVLYEQHPSTQSAYAYGRALLLVGKYNDSIIFLEQAADEESDQRSWQLIDLGLAYALAGDCSIAQTVVVRAQSLNKGVEFVTRLRQVQDTIASICNK